MCAKTSKLRIQVAQPSSSSPNNRTPQSSAKKTMSSKQRKPNNKSKPQTPSESEASNGTIPDDFLGRRPSTTPSDPTSSIEDDFLGRRPSTTPSEASSDESDTRQQTNQPTHRHQRKQVKPKKRKDKVTKEIVRLQSTTNLLIPRAPFQRLVREIMQNFKNDFRVQSSTLACLQEAAESYLTSLFEDSFLLSLHRSRQTLAEKDIRLILMLRGPTDSGR